MRTKYFLITAGETKREFCRVDNIYKAIQTAGVVDFKVIKQIADTPIRSNSYTILPTPPSQIDITEEVKMYLERIQNNAITNKA